MTFEVSMQNELVAGGPLRNICATSLAGKLPVFADL
jgi:hypothetical protein